MLYKWKHRICNLLGLDFFSLGTILWRHPGCCVYQEFILSYCWTVFYGTRVLQFVQPLVPWRTGGCFQCLAVKSEAVVTFICKFLHEHYTKTCIQMFTAVFIYSKWGYFSKMLLLIYKWLFGTAKNIYLYLYRVIFFVVDLSHF